MPGKLKKNLGAMGARDAIRCGSPWRRLGRIRLRPATPQLGIPTGGVCSNLWPASPIWRRRRWTRLERLPYTWNHVIEKESLKFKELEHVGIEKVQQLF